MVEVYPGLFCPEFSDITEITCGFECGDCPLCLNGFDAIEFLINNAPPVIHDLKGND